MTQSGMKTVSETAALIGQGKVLLVAGVEAALRELPAGDWIGGSIPYFMSDEGGIVDGTRLFVHVLPDACTAHSARLYDADALTSVYRDGPEGGLAFIIVPASSDTHLRFAKEAPTYPDYLAKPLVGWVSGVHLEDLGRAAPVVIDGRSRDASRTMAVVLHVGLPKDLHANLDIVNLFTPGDGDTITFDEVGFSATHARVNGERVELAKYLTDTGVDTKLPLVADYYGAMVNVSFQGVDEQTGEVRFYAPVFPGRAYRIARPVADYVADFERAIPEAVNDAAFSCNCILNFVYGELEGQKTKRTTGPVTFGEIAYQLLNQTLVYVNLV